MSSIKRFSSGLGALLLSVTLLCSVACTEQIGDIDRTQSNKLKKEHFHGIWHMVRTITGVPYGVAFTFVGEMSFGSNPKILWDVQENHLVAFPTYENLEGAEMGFHSKNIRKYWDMDALRDDDPDNDFIDIFVGQPICAFKIESHFDVSRKYNAQTGEQSNVLEENTYDRPWYEREYIRVDWSSDSVADFQFKVGRMPTSGTPYYVQDIDDPNNPDLPEFEEDYIGIVLKMFVEPQSSGQCSVYTLATGDCAGGVVKARYSFKRVRSVPNYNPQRWHNSYEMDKFGFFLSERYTYDDDTGLTYSGRDQKIGRWNLWDQVWSFHDLEGDTRTCIMDADCDREAGEICYQEQWFVDGYCRGRTLLRPSVRYQGGDGVHPIIFHLSADFPEHLLEETYEMADNWNDTFKEAISWMLFWDLKDDENGGMYLTRYCETDSDCSTNAATISKVVNLPNQGLTLIAYEGADGNPAMMQTQDGGYPADYAGKALARFVNALPGSGAVTFSSGGNAVATGVEFDASATYSTYSVLDPGKVTFSASGGNVTEEITNVNVEAGHIYLFVLAEGKLIKAESNLLASQGDVTGDQGIRVVHALANHGPQNVVINGSRRASTVLFGEDGGFAAPGYNGTHTVNLVSETSRQDITCYHADNIGRCVGSRITLLDTDKNDREIIKEEMPALFVLCRNKFQGSSCESREGIKSDLNDCRYTRVSSKAIKQNPCRDDVPKANALKKIGDSRYSLVYYIREAQSASPLGYGPSAHDPETGEIYYAAANIYGSGLMTYSQYAKDIVDLLNGDLVVDETITGKYIRDFLESMNFEEGSSLFQERSGALSVEDHAAHSAGHIKPATAPAATPAMLSLLKNQTLAPSHPPNPVESPELFRFMHDREYRTRLIREVVDGFATQEQLEARFSKIAGTPIEQIMINNEVKLALSHGNLQPGDILDEADIEKLSPLSWATQSAVNAEKERMDKLINTAHSCIFMADFLDDAVYGLANDFKTKGLKGEALREALEKVIYGGVMEHEVGHTIGLRHNFAGSNDLFNFFDEYYDIRERERVPCENDNWCEAENGEKCADIPCQTDADCGASLSCDLNNQCVDENEKEFGFCHATVEAMVPCSLCPGGTVCDEATGACVVQRSCAQTTDCEERETCDAQICSKDGAPVQTPYIETVQQPVMKLTPRPYMTEGEVLARRTEYQYSTVMDYGGRFNADIHGLGKYDYAAIKAGYANLLDVYEDTDRFRSYVDNYANFYGYPPTQFGHFFNTENWRYAGTVFSAFTYLESYIGVEENKKRLPVPWDQVRYEHEMTETYQRKGYDWSYIEVPYRACYDEYRGNLGCYYFDTGVDIGEMVYHAMNSLRYYYLFDAFKRERFSFAQYGNPLSYYYRIIDRYMNPIGDAGMYYALYYHIFKDYLWFATWKDSPFQGRTLRLTSETAFQYLVDLMASPAPGSHKFDAETGQYENISYQMNAADSELDIPVGVGKFPYTQFQPLGGYYDFKHSLWIGSFWEKLASLLTLTDSTAYFTSNFVSELGTGGASAIGFNTIYQVELTNVLGGIIADKFDLYAGVREQNNTFRTRRVIGPLLEETGQDLVAPSITNMSFKIWVAAYGLSFLPAGFDPTFVDSLAVYFDGNGSQFDTNSEVSTVTFEDPFGMKIYTALTNNYSYVDQYGQQRDPFGVAADVIAQANQAKGRWEAAIANGNQVEISSAEEDMKGQIQTLNYLRQLNSILGSFYF